MNASATSQDNTLAAFQRDFVQALFGADGLGAATHPGFAVYRNTVRGGCIDALEANYPVVDRAGRPRLVPRRRRRVRATAPAQRRAADDVRRGFRRLPGRPGPRRRAAVPARRGPAGAPVARGPCGRRRAGAGHPRAAGAAARNPARTGAGAAPRRALAVVRRSPRAQPLARAPDR
ncbi:MAG: putative DNA-binding domain-containing protein [Burkholderiaceae bacterium]